MLILIVQIIQSIICARGQNSLFVDMVNKFSIICLQDAHVLCSDRSEKLASRVSEEQAETSRKNPNSSLTGVADTNTDRLTPRALRYARRSGGLVEPYSQPARRTSTSTAKSPHNTPTSSGPSTTVELRGTKRRNTDPAASEIPSKKAKKVPHKPTTAPSTSFSHKQQESSTKKPSDRRRSPKSTVVDRKQTSRQTSRKASNLERGKEKAAKDDKLLTKATGSQSSAAATGVGRVTAKKHPQRSAATATGGAEASSSSSTSVAGETSTAGGTSQSGRTVTRRAATKRGGASLSCGSHLTDTTGSCASSK